MPEPEAEWAGSEFGAGGGVGRVDEQRAEDPKPKKTLLQKVQKLGRLLGKAWYRRMLGCGLVGAMGGVGLSSLFGSWTGLDGGLMGLPAGYLIGRSVSWGARGKRSKDAGRMTVFLVILAFLLGDVPRYALAGAGWWGTLWTIPEKAILLFLNQEFTDFGKFAQTLGVLVSVVAGGFWAKLMNE